MIAESILDIDLYEAAARIRGKFISSFELTTMCLKRIDRLQSRLKCFISLDPDRALAAARKADTQLARGDRLGPLHGVPVAHKDVFYRAGRVTTCGSAILRDFVPNATAIVLERMDRAGAIELGTLNLAEFAAGGTGHNMHYGDCSNPWNTAYTPGGSSSGSACAVASRMIFGSLGTDTAGSVRWPASLCGVVGLRPTLGLIPTSGVMPRAWSLDTVGPIARSVRDCARILDVIGSGDSDEQPQKPAYEGAAGKSVGDYRVGVPISFFSDDVPDETRSALSSSLDVFRRLGVKILPVPVPDPVLAFSFGDVLAKTEAARLHRGWLRDRPGEYGPGIRSQLESGLSIPAARYREALRMRGPMLVQFVDSVFRSVDALHIPVHPHVPPTMDDCAPRSEEKVAEFWATYPRFTRPISYLGLPALTLPCGIFSCGVPIGMQLVGRPFGEAALFALGHAYQQQTQWHVMSPSVSAAIEQF
mgnify:CR=1 FL=1